MPATTTTRQLYLPPSALEQSQQQTNSMSSESQNGNAATDDPAAELIREHQQLQKSYEGLNALNPMSQDYKGPGAQGVVAATGPLGDLQKLLAAPAVQGYLGLFSNPRFSDGFNQVWQHPNRMTLCYAEAGLFVFMIFFRAWRFSKARHWAHKVWTNFYTAAMGFGLGSIVLPSVVIGESYVKTLQGIWELAQKSLLGH